VAMESAQDRADYPRYLLRLCELERIDRERRNVERRIRLARFPQTEAAGVEFIKENGTGVGVRMKKAI
jgi:hypothetical protein